MGSDLALRRLRVPGDFKSVFFLYTIAFLLTFRIQLTDFSARMHVVTSSLLLTSYVHILLPSSITLLLRTYFVSALAVWVSRRRPPITINTFYERSSPNLLPPAKTDTLRGLARGRDEHLSRLLASDPTEHDLAPRRTPMQAPADACTILGFVWHHGGGDVEERGSRLARGRNARWDSVCACCGLDNGKTLAAEGGRTEGEWDFDGLWPDTRSIIGKK